MLSKGLNQLKHKTSKLRQSSLAKDSFWLLGSKGLNIFIQAAYFILLARTLGPSEYGVFVGVAALATMVNSFAGWGSSQILVKHVAVDRSLLKYYWGNGLATIFCMGALLTLVFTAIGPAISRGNFPPLIIALIFIADLIGFNISHLSISAFIAAGKARISAFKAILIGTTKLLAAFILALLVTDAGATQWAYLYCISTTLPALVSIWMVNTWLDKPKFSLPRLRKEIVQGFYFSISQSSDFINENVDKIMLASVASLQATGLYGAGFRILTVFKIPIMSVAGATFPRFFQHGTRGLKGSFQFAKKLMPIAIAYGLVSCLVIFIISPHVEQVLGQEYADIKVLLHMVALLPLITTFQVLGGDSLTGAHHQSYRTSVQVFAAGLNVILNIWLIPLYSWYGAAWATMTSESVKVIGFFVCIIFLLNKRSAFAPHQQ
jgi:O-antigen/teichoic acid export membrane protein